MRGVTEHIEQTPSSKRQRLAMTTGRSLYDTRVLIMPASSRKCIAGPNIRRGSSLLFPPHRLPSFPPGEKPTNQTQGKFRTAPPHFPGDGEKKSPLFSTRGFSSVFIERLSPGGKMDNGNMGNDKVINISNVRRLKVSNFSIGGLPDQSTRNSQELS